MTSKQVKNSELLEKNNYDQAQEFLEKYAHVDAEVLPDKVVAEIEQLKIALTEEKENANATVATIHQTIASLSSEEKIKGRFQPANHLEYDSYHLELDDTNITLGLIPAAHQYEWKFEEDLQFGVDKLPALDVLHKDLSVLKKSNLFHQLFNATQADTRNPAAIAQLEELLASNTEKKKKALITEWRETLEYALTDLKDERSGKSIFIDQLFPYTKNGKTKSYKIIRADRTGLVVMIDEELELDRKFPIDAYAYELIDAFLPLLKKHKGKTPSVKPSGRSSKGKQGAKGTPAPADQRPTEESPGSANADTISESLS
jgi:hypothetical protein